MLNIDAILPDNVLYDRESKRFRYAETGRFVSRQETLSLQTDFVTTLTERLKGFAEALVNGDNNESIAASVDAADTLKKIHLNQAAIARGGVDKLTSEDLGRTGNILRNQYYRGKDPDTGQRFGLKHLINDIKAKGLSVEKVRYRLGLYAQSGKLSYYQTEEQVKISNGFTLKKRRLTPGHIHCQSCIRYDGFGWINIGDSLPFPTQQCECHTNCKCVMEYR